MGLDLFADIPSAAPAPSAASSSPVDDLFSDIPAAAPVQPGFVAGMYQNGVLVAPSGRQPGDNPAPEGYQPVSRMDSITAEPARATFVQGMDRSLQNMQKNLYAGVEAAGEGIGIDAVTRFGREGRIRNEAEAKAAGPAAVQFTDIRGVGDAGQFAQDTMADLAPQVGLSLGGAAAGAAVGSLLGPLGTVAGGALGAFAPNLVMSTGEVQSKIKEKAPDMVAPGAAFAGGGAIAALDSILPAKIGSTLLRSFGREGAEKIAEAAVAKAVARGLVARVGVEAGKGAGIEGVTEALQEAIGEVAASSGASTPISPDLAWDMLNAGAAGALGGAAMGGAGGAIPPRAAAPADPNAPPLPENIPAGAMPAETLLGPDPGSMFDDIPSAPVDNVPVAPAIPAQPVDVQPDPVDTPPAPPPRNARLELADILNDPRSAAEIRAEMEGDGRMPAPPPPEPPPPPSGDRRDPVRIETPEDVTTSAERTVQPSAAQAEAGNYQKRHVNWNGLDISIETEAGQDRTGVAPDGTPWSVTLPAPYGYIKRTKGADGDQIDVYVGPNPQGSIFVVDQINPKTQRFDESKVMLGFDAEDQARAYYAAGFSDGSGPTRAGNVTEMTPAQFKQWVQNGNTKRALRYREPISAGLSPDQFRDLRAIIARPGESLDPAKLEQEIGAKASDIAGVLRRLTETNEVRMGREGRFSRIPRRSDTPSDLLTFIAARGGVSPEAASEIPGLRRVFIPGYGPVIRANGRSLDETREAASHAGYIAEDTDINPLLEALDWSTRGRKIFSIYDQQGVLDQQERSEQTETERTNAEMRQRLNAVAKSMGIRIDEAEIAEAARLISEGMADEAALDQAVERVAIQELDAAFNRADERNDNVFLDELNQPFLAEFIQRRQEALSGARAPDDSSQGQEPVSGEAAGSAPASVEPREDREPVVAEAAPAPTVEPGADGKPQTVLPGAERIGQGEQAQRAADKPLKAKAPQKDAGGLFGDDRNEVSLFDDVPAAPPKSQGLANIKAKQAEKAAEPQKVGENRFGDPVFEAADGKRSYISNGITLEQGDGDLTDAFRTREEAETQRAVDTAGTLEERIERYKAQDKTWAEVQNLLDTKAMPTDELLRVAKLWNKGKPAEPPAADPFDAAFDSAQDEADGPTVAITPPDPAIVEAARAAAAEKAKADKAGKAGNSKPEVSGPAAVRQLNDDFGNWMVPENTILKTESGREIGPAPAFDDSSPRKRTMSLMRQRGWLIAEAAEEARRKRDAFMQRMFEDMNPRNFTRSDSDSINTYLFDADSPQAKHIVRVAAPERAARPPRTKTETAVSAVKNVAQGADAALGALSALFNSQGRPGSGLTFDEDTYAKAKPLFITAAGKFREAASDIAELTRQMVLDLRQNFGLTRDGMEAMKPFLRRFVDDVTSGKVRLGEEPTNGNATAADGRPLGEDGERDTGEGLAAGQPERTGPDRVLAPEPAQDDAGDAGAESAGGAGARRSAQGDEGGSDADRGGDAPKRRPRAGRKAVADEGAGGGRPDATDEQPANVRPNYHIADPERLIGGGPKARFARNRAAIEAYQDIAATGRDPTQEELDAMAGYIGWGSFGQALFQGSFEYDRAQPDWKAESAWLRKHLGKEAWEAAQASIINAHYTDPPTVAAMWSMVRKLGFKGGRVLEPSMGIGNFFGMMPRDLMGASTLTGIELDPTTGGMAKLLYPQAGVQVKGYQDSKTADGFYDLVIGNWPFAKEGPSDRRYAKMNPSLHDYFFVKALDQTRPGGIVIGITSAGTMDKVGTTVRGYLARNAELVASFRLPSGAFEKYAGTNVVTDIIILKKRETPIASAAGEPWLNTADYKTPAGPDIRVNQYYLDNPDKVLGTLDYGSGSTYGRPAMIVERPADLQQRLEKIADTLPAGTMTEIRRGAEPRFITSNTTDRQNAVTVTGDKLYVTRGDRQVLLEDVVKYKLTDEAKTAKREAQIKALVGLRRLHGELIDTERDGAADTETRRAALKKAYDGFRKAHGAIKGSDGITILRKLDDPFYPALAALERADGTPSLILTERTTRAPRKPGQPTIRQAFAMQRNEGARVDIERIAELAKKPAADVERDLLDSGAVFKTPGGGIEVADIFLSGNVRRKLREAQEAEVEGEDMAASIEALRKVIPKDIPYFQIEAKLGAPWVPNRDYETFMRDLLGVGADRAKDIKIAFTAGSWKVRFGGGLNNTDVATTTKGVPDFRFDKLVQAAMNNSSIKITYKDQDGNRVTDEAASALANDKAAKLREEFSEWAWRDPERRVALERGYNEQMNAIATARFDGSFLEFPGMALRRGEDQFSLRKHQVDAIWRGLANGRGIYAHEVGTGKTFTMAGIAVESRRYGIARKPLIFAHNANSATVAREFNEMYPGAKVLYVDNLSPDNIAVTLQRIATDDWDAIVMPHSLIDRMALSEKTLMEIAQEDIAALEAEAMLAAEEDGSALDVTDMDDPDAMKKVRSPTAKELVRERNKIIKSIKDMAIRASKEGAVTFEDLGIDQIIVDEAHEFKKPPITTRMKMKGLNTATSNRSIALRFLTDYVKKQNNGRGVHTFTGTPITNTLTEIYNMMRYVMDDSMARDGVKDWDAWFNTFADSTSDVELTATGEYEPVTRLAAFVNVAELRRMAGQFMDIVFASDMPEFKPRETSNGKTLASTDLTPAERKQLTEGFSDKPIGRPYKKIVVDVAPVGPSQRRALDILVARAQEFKNASKKERRDMMMKGDPAVPIRVETDAANASLDARLFEPDAPDDAESKANRAIKNAVSIYKGDAKATQVFFMERGFSSSATSTTTLSDGTKIKQKTDRFNLVKEIVDKLVAEGVSRNEIAVVDGATSKERRLQIADDMNASKVRIVIGNSQTLGVGVNMQKWLRAMHHLDAPWMPGSLEQRNGRGERQGNHWNTVLEYRYLTEKLDGRRWQVLSVKDRFIKAFLKADESVRIIEGDTVSDDEKISADGLADTLAQAAGDPRLLLINKLQADVLRLENRERMHTFGIADALERARELAQRIERDAVTLEGMRKDAAHVEALREAESFTATVAGRDFTERKEAQEALQARIARGLIGEDETVIATVQGFDLMSVPVERWRRTLADTHTFVIQRDSERYEVNPTIGSIEATMRQIPSRVRRGDEVQVERAESIVRMEEASKQTFAQEKTLRLKRTGLDDLKADLQKNPVPPPTWLRAGAPVDTLIYVDGKERVVTGHTFGDDTYIIQTEKGDVPYLDARGADGAPLFDARPFEAPAKPEPPPKGGVTAPKTASASAGVGSIKFDANLSPEDAAYLAEVIASVAGEGVRIGFPQSINIEAGTAAAKAWGQQDQAFEASGYYDWVNDVVAVSQTLGNATTAYHEAFHRLQSRALTERQMTVLKAELPRLRALVAGSTLNRDVDVMSAREIEADAFSIYAVARDKATFPRGIPAQVRQIWDRLYRIVRAVANAMRGMGFQTYEDIFDAAYAGDLADAANEARDGVRPLNTADQALSVPPGTQDTPKNRQSLMWQAIRKGQPIERAFRILPDIFGALDAEGRFKPGVWLDKTATRIITETKLDPDGRFGWLSGTIENARAGLIDRYGQSEDYKARDRQRANDERAVLQEGAEIIGELMKRNLSVEESKVLQAMLTGQAVSEGDMGKLAEPIRIAIDHLGATAAELGLISPESYERNRGAYLHRVYMKDLNTGTALGRFVDRTMTSRRKKILGDTQKGRGMFEDVSMSRLLQDDPEFREAKRGPAVKGEKFRMIQRFTVQKNTDGTETERETKRIWWPADRPVPAKWQVYRDAGLWEVRAIEGGNAVLWRDYTKDERTRMGEILDARYLIAKTYSLMAHDLANGRFFQDIASNEDWSQAHQPPEGTWMEAGKFSRAWNDMNVQWVKVPDDVIPDTGGKKRWAGLAGRYVRAEIWRDLNETAIAQNPSVWRRLYTQWKINKTARSPVTHMNNIMSNLIFMDLADIRISDLATGIRSFIKKDAAFQLAQQHGAFGGDMASVEFQKDVLQPLLDELTKQQTENAAGNPWLAKAGFAGKMADIIWSAVKKGDKAMLDAYRIEDEVFRMATFIKRRELGDTPQAAADFARRQFLDYDIKAPWVAAARNTVLPFISYVYRAAPLIAQAIAHRPWKMAKYFAVYYAANAIAYGLDEEGDEERERASLRKDEQGYLWTQSPRMIRMPWRDSNGLPVFLDVRRWNPAGDVFDTAQGSAALPVPAPLMPGGPLMIAAEFFVNRMGYTGKDITNSRTDTWGDKGDKVGDWLWKSSMPNAPWVPGSWSAEKVGKAWGGGVDRGGNPLSLKEALASSVGVKLAGRDIDQGFQFKMYEFRKQRQDLQQEARALSRQRSQNLISQSAFEKELAHIIVKQQKVATDAADLGKKMQTKSQRETTP